MRVCTLSSQQPPFHLIFFSLEERDIPWEPELHFIAMKHSIKTFSWDPIWKNLYLNIYAYSIGPFINQKEMYLAKLIICRIQQLHHPDGHFFFFFLKKKNKCSNFPSDKSRIIIFQTPSCKTFCRWRKRCLTFKISIDCLTESVKRTLTRSMVESRFKKFFFCKKKQWSSHNPLNSVGLVPFSFD